MSKPGRKIKYLTKEEKRKANCEKSTRYYNKNKLTICGLRMKRYYNKKKEVTI